MPNIRWSQIFKCDSFLHVSVLYHCKLNMFLCFGLFWSIKFHMVFIDLTLELWSGAKYVILMEDTENQFGLKNTS